MNGSFFSFEIEWVKDKEEEWVTCRLRQKIYQVVPAVTPMSPETFFDTMAKVVRDSQSSSDHVHPGDSRDLNNEPEETASATNTTDLNLSENAGSVRSRRRPSVLRMRKRADRLEFNAEASSAPQRR